MKAEIIFFKGKGKWVTTIKTDKFGFWKVQLYLDPDSLVKFNELQKTPKKVKTILKKDEDGYFILLRRPQQKTIRGKVVAFLPPSVLDNNNAPWGKDPIGNGSDLTVKVIHYPYKNPTTDATEYAFRLEAIRVDNLVPYKPLKDMEDANERKQVEGLVEQPVTTELPPF